MKVHADKMDVWAGRFHGNREKTRRAVTDGKMWNRDIAGTSTDVWCGLARRKRLSVGKRGDGGTFGDVGGEEVLGLIRCS